MNTILEDHIKNSPLVQAAITEAVHRYYHDRVLDDTKKRWNKDQKDAFELSAHLLSNLWNLNPGWRFTLLNAPKRYQADVNTNSVSIYGKPKEIKELMLQIQIK